MHKLSWHPYIRAARLAIVIMYMLLFSCQGLGDRRMYSGYKRFIPRPFNGAFENLFRNIWVMPLRFFIQKKCIYVTDAGYFSSTLGQLFNKFLSLAWLCEKMKINIKIKLSAHTIWQYFDNDTLINNTLGFEESTDINFHYAMAWFGDLFLPSEYGYQILSKLSLKEDLKKTADSWFAKHIKGDWIAVHYRGTDIEAYKETKYKNRFMIELDPYITYLQAILDNQCNIFACSDQIQFIDKMHKAFPGRVFARDILRSYNSRPMHVDKRLCREVVDLNHEAILLKDALLDVLILAKAPLIYTTGSGFVDIVRYFNPNTRIVSMDERKIGRGKNCLPIPRKDLFDKLRIQ